MITRRHVPEVRHERPAYADGQLSCRSADVTCIRRASCRRFFDLRKQQGLLVLPLASTMQALQLRVLDLVLRRTSIDRDETDFLGRTSSAVHGSAGDVNNPNSLYTPPLPRRPSASSSRSIASCRNARDSRLSAVQYVAGSSSRYARRVRMRLLPPALAQGSARRRVRRAGIMGCRSVNR